MRPLTEDETKVVFEKLYKFIGKNVKSLIDKDDSAYVLRLHKQRVFFVREDIMRRATSISRDNLQSFGTCLGKFTHSSKFHLTVSCLDLLAQYVKHKVRRHPRCRHPGGGEGCHACLRQLGRQRARLVTKKTHIQSST
mmetsp:Transcript_58594/g.186807  ORF Transcript_58594/g.186807 Transcript_58594/m.186807 type:complete len:138 (+) Transcript_58594:91-504(+)